MTALTIFTSPKSFTRNLHIGLIQYNAIGSWAHLGDDVRVVLIGDEDGTAEAASEFGVMHYRDVRCNDHGTPYIPAMFDIARTQTDSGLLAFVNADVILMRDFVDTALRVAKEEKEFLLVGQRYDIEITDRIDFDGDWQADLRKRIAVNPHLHGPSGSDYFIFPRGCYLTVPELVIGRAGWDNWMIYEARQQNLKAIDCTSAITVLHQNHDYSHLPGGVIHFRLPESNDNVKAGGGFLHIFRLTDANWVMLGNTIKKRKPTWKSFWREVEILPLVNFHSDKVGKLFFYLAHPRRGWLALRGWISRKFGTKDIPETKKET